MPTTAVRITAAVIFLAVMFGVRELAHAVTDLGAVAWGAAFAGIFWAGITLENWRRREAGLPDYSWAESRELIGPLAALVAVLLAAWIYSSIH